MASDLPSGLSDRAFGYQPGGMYPATVISLVLMTATAFNPPQAAKSVLPSAANANAVGAKPRVFGDESVLVRMTLLVAVSITDIESLLLLATYSRLLCSSQAIAV